jgi:hypothetical protein
LVSICPALVYREGRTIDVPGYKILMGDLIMWIGVYGSIP